MVIHNLETTQVKLLHKYGGIERALYTKTDYDIDNAIFQ